MSLEEIILTIAFSIVMYLLLVLVHIFKPQKQKDIFHIQIPEPNCGEEDVYINEVIQRFSKQINQPALVSTNPNTDSVTIKRI